MEKKDFELLNRTLKNDIRCWYIHLCGNLMLCGVIGFLIFYFSVFQIRFKLDIVAIIILVLFLLIMHYLEKIPRTKFNEMLFAKKYLKIQKCKKEVLEKELENLKKFFHEKRENFSDAFCLESLLLLEIAQKKLENLESSEECIRAYNRYLDYYVKRISVVICS